MALSLLFPKAAMPRDLHQRFDLSDVEVSSPNPSRRAPAEREDSLDSGLDSELDAVLADLKLMNSRAA
jgi:hypothetical protein